MHFYSGPPMHLRSGVDTGRLERCGYVAVRNPGAADGLWVIGGRRQAVYGNSALVFTDRLKAARECCNNNGVWPYPEHF